MSSVDIVSSALFIAIDIITTTGHDMSHDTFHQTQRSLVDTRTTFFFIETEVGKSSKLGCFRICDVAYRQEVRGKVLCRCKLSSRIE